VPGDAVRLGGARLSGRRRVLWAPLCGALAVCLTESRCRLVGEPRLAGYLAVRFCAGPGQAGRLTWPCLLAAVAVAVTGCWWWPAGLLLGMPLHSASPCRALRYPVHQSLRRPAIGTRRTAVGRPVRAYLLVPCPRCSALFRGSRFARLCSRITTPGAAGRCGGGRADARLLPAPVRRDRAGPWSSHYLSFHALVVSLPGVSDHHR